MSLLVPAAVAGATSAKPVWRITSLSAPTNFAPGDGTESNDLYVVTVTNFGGAPSGAPIVVSDTLPAGLTYDAMGGYGEEGVQAGDDGRNEIVCSGGPPLSCTDTGALQPGQSLTLLVPVNVAGNAPASVINEVNVSGGGAPSASASETTTIGSTLPGFGFQSFDGSILGADGLPDTQAGSHPYAMTFDLNLNTLPHAEAFGRLDPAGNPKQLTTNLPAGLVVNPNATLTRCTEAQLESDFTGSGPSDPTKGCPDSSAVGTIRVKIGLPGFPLNNPTGLFNMVPPPGVPAELGFDADGFGIYVHLYGGVRTGGDYGLSATANDILQYGSIVGAQVELWGNPSEPSHDAVRGRCAVPSYHGPRLCSAPSSGKPLLTLPSTCSEPLTFSLAANSWQEPGNFISSSFSTHDLAGGPVGVTGCSALDFTPSLSVQPDTQAAGSPTGLSVDLRVPQDESLEPGWN